MVACSRCPTCVSLPAVATRPPEAEDVKAGWIAFGVFLAARRAAVVLLGFSLVKQLRKAAGRPRTPGCTATNQRGLRRRLPNYRFWPGTKFGPELLRLQIAWRPARFDRDHGTLTTRLDYQERPVPWVRLLDGATGRRVFVINIHNSPWDQEADRDSATRKEIRLFGSFASEGP